MHYWLMKSEPDAFSIDDLKKRPKQTEPWDGVRNYQARNFMKQMQAGDLAFFYHSNCAVPGIIGIMQIAKIAYPDSTQFDANSKYYDPKSTIENPRWYRVDVKLVEKFPTIISLESLKQIPHLHGMQLLKKGNRLSVMPVTNEEWAIIEALRN